MTFLLANTNNQSTNPTMKSKSHPRLLLLLIPMLLLATHQSSLAFGGPPGGPFSNGSYFPNDGTFSAVIRGNRNGNVLVGTVQFSTTQGSGPQDSTTATLGGADGGTTASLTQSQGTGGVGSTGVSTIYFNGDTLRGNSQGSLNPQASSMTITFQGAAQGQGNGSVSVGKEVENTTTSNGTTTTTTTTIPYRQISYFDSLYLNGYSVCKTSNSFPNQKFQGSGRAEFQHLVFGGDTPFLDAVQIPVSVSGVRLSNTASSFNTTPIQPPSVTEVSVLVE